jgi:hypothetical protein
MAKKKTKAGNGIFQDASRLWKRKAYSTWQKCIDAATAAYNRGVSRSPKKKSTMAKRKRAAPKPRKITRIRRSRLHVAGSGISTTSRRHTDYNRNKVNITVGSINKDKKRAREKTLLLIEKKEGDKFKAKRKPVKRKIQKQITKLKADYRRLSI